MRTYEQLRKLSLKELENITLEERQLAQKHLDEERRLEQESHDKAAENERNRLSKILSPEDFEEYKFREKKYEESIAGHYFCHDEEWEMYVYELYKKYKINYYE